MITSSRSTSLTSFTLRLLINALTTTIATMVFGEGFDATTLDGRLAFDQWNLNDELRKACVDFQIQGGFALEVNWSLDRTTIANVSHLPFENIRSWLCKRRRKGRLLLLFQRLEQEDRGGRRDLHLRP